MRKLRRAALVEAKNPSKMDKYIAYYMHGKELPDKMKPVAILMEKANGLLCAGYSTDQAVKSLMTTDNICRQYAYKIIRQAITLFGDIKKASKDGLRAIQAERLNIIANIARQKGDLGIALEAEVQRNKLFGLYTQDKDSDDGNIQLPSIINFSNDIKILNVVG